MNELKIISQKSVFQAELFDVREIKLINSNGKARTHHIAKRDSTISVFPLTNNNEIYLVSQYRYILGRESLESVAGFIDKKETSLSAAKRELKEETGITATQWEEIAKIEIAASVFKGAAHLFLAKGLEIGFPSSVEGEDIKLVKISLKQALAKVMSGEINVSATIVGILMLDELRRKKKI